MSVVPPPLFVACETNNLDMLKEALETEAVDTLSPNQSFTPLMVAANRGGITLVNHLLSVGAKVNAQSEGGFTPLILAIIGYNEINSIKKMENDTTNPSMAVINALLDAGADVNLATDGGNTALQEAALHGLVDICRLLLSKKADVNAVNEWKETALFICGLKSGSVEIAQLLIDHGADLTAKDVDGNTALDMAVKNKNEAVAQLLLK
jgi:ankyrin repeat protein